MNKRNALTMIEVLVVMAIIALLAALLLPVFLRAKHYSKVVPCTSNLEQIGAAWHLYLNDNDDQMPYGIANMLTVNPSLKKVLVCPADTTKLGNEVEFEQLKFKESYYYLPTMLDIRTRIAEADPDFGIFVCFAHGTKILPMNSDASPALGWEGLALRLRRDGSVQHAQIPLFCGPKGSHLVGKQTWATFTDVPCQGEMCMGLPNKCPGVFK